MSFLISHTNVTDKLTLNIQRVMRYSIRELNTNRIPYRCFYVTTVTTDRHHECKHELYCSMLWSKHAYTDQFWVIRDIQFSDLRILMLSYERILPFFPYFFVLLRNLNRDNFNHCWGSVVPLWCVHTIKITSQNGKPRFYRRENHLLNMFLMLVLVRFDFIVF